MAGLQASSRVATVSDIMTGWVVTAAPSDSLLKARDVMTQNRASQLVVADQRNRPIGLISKRDVARFLLDDNTTRSLEEIPVSEACSKSIPTMRTDVSVLNAARMFDTENLACAVVTNDNPLSGIITETDLCHYFSQKWPGKFRVTDFMRSDFIFAKSSYPVVHVAHAIVFRQPSVPVIDEELVGILTLSDVLSISEKIPTVTSATVHLNDKAELALITTKDLMTRNPITTHEGTDIAQAAQIMIKKSVSSLPVVDLESTVIGLITKHDIVKALGQIDRSLILEA
jgi:CBS domain-containing protein